jgi:hypothetical protein
VQNRGPAACRKRFLDILIDSESGTLQPFVLQKILPAFTEKFAALAEKIAERA